jgi:hypothetical protein
MFRFAAELFPWALQCVSITGGEGDSILTVRCIIMSKVDPVNSNMHSP